MGFDFYTESGDSYCTASGVQSPLLGIQYNLGTLTTKAQSHYATATGTQFLNTVNIEKSWLKTAGGNKFRIHKILSNTALEFDRAAPATESGVTYQIYRRPTTEDIYLSVTFDTSESVNWFAYVGLDGNVRATAQPILGMRITSAQPLHLKANLYYADYWFGVSSSEVRLNWIINKPKF